MISMGAESGSGSRRGSRQPKRIQEKAGIVTSTSEIPHITSYYGNSSMTLQHICDISSGAGEEIKSSGCICAWRKSLISHDHNRVISFVIPSDGSTFPPL